RLKEQLGSDFTVQTRMEQRSDTFRMISMEKWVTFAMLIFILLIASFNIISTLSLLIIEKRDNMGTLKALGASQKFITQIFVWEGWLITMAGGIGGCIIGIALSLAQQHLGLIKLDADPSALTIDVYPVRVECADILAVLGTLFVTGLIIGLLSKIFTRKIN
ncbi:MAG: FtsX-like permease family protein, partial [Muribaculaceae bacterium]|nr:FtsX-like permease family protein [Muribaculaceae bacterium]